MATRVNIRFVTILAAVLMMLAGGALVTVVLVLKRSGEQHVAIGDKRMAEGDYEKAAESYAKAVFKDQRNVEWCAKWIAALEQTTPTPRQAYADRFWNEYMGALSALADSASADADQQLRFLESRHRIFSAFAPDLTGWEAMVSKVNGVLAHLGGGVGENSPGAARIRKYRGLSRMGIFRLVGMAQRPPEEVEQTREDLAAALAASPDDEEAAVGLAFWFVMAGGEAEATSQARAAELRDRAKSVLGDYAASAAVGGAPAPRARLMRLQILIAEWVETAPASRTLGETYQAHRAEFEEIIRAVDAQPGASLESNVVSNLAMMVATMPEPGSEDAIGLVDRALEKKPGDGTLLFARARLELLARRLDEAATGFQRVIDLPDPKLSLAGMQLFSLRAEARRWQAQAMFAAWEFAQTPEAKSAALAKAKDYRNRLAQEVGENERVLLLLDAKASFIEGDAVTARTKLDRFIGLTGSADMEASLLMAELMLREGNLGEARKQLQAVLRRDRSNRRALGVLASIERQLRNYKEAAAYLKILLSFEPENAEAKAEFDLMSSLAEGTESPDPVIRALSKATELTSGVEADYGAAAGVLREALATTPDARLAIALARVLLLEDKRDEAKVVVQDGLAKFPDDAGLKGLSTALATDDPIGAMRKYIEEMDATPLQKKLYLFRLNVQAGRIDEAKAALNEAASLDADDPRVLEGQFQAALGEKNVEAAKRVAERAAAADADRMKGEWYRARLDVAEGRYAEAAAKLDIMLNADKLNVEFWRLLGNIRLLLNQVEPAANAFSRALELRPTDVASIVGLVRSRAATQRYDEALDFARKSQTIAGNDLDFVDLWLSLEASAPRGDRARALEVRRRLAIRIPDNDRNNVALALLHINEGQFDDAKAIIDRQVAARATMRTTELLARWNAAQGNIDEASKAVQDYVSTLPPEQVNEQPFLLLATVLAGYGQSNAALAAYEEARKRQSKTTMEADRQLGAFWFSNGHYEQAIQCFQRVLESPGRPQSDPDHRLTRGIVEALLQLGRYADAKARLDALGAAVISDGALLSLKASTLTGLGDRAGAGALYDDAIAAAKSEPSGYIQRAAFLAADPDRLGDAETDLLQALALDAGSIDARQRLASLCASTARWSEAIEVLRQGLVLEPENDAIRSTLISYYLDRNQADEALAVVDQALSRRPDSIDWLFRAGQVASTAQRWDVAVRYAERIMSRADKSAQAAVLFVDALLRSSKPDLEKGLAVVNAPGLEIAKSRSLLMSRARLHMARREPVEAMRDVAAAFALIDQVQATPVNDFFSALEMVYPAPADRAASLESLKPADGFKSWFSLMAIMARGLVAEHQTQAREELTALGETSPDPDIRRFVYSVLGTIANSDSKPEEAVRLWRKGLEVTPDDAELNNNVAYLLASALGKATEALPYAEKAAARAPGNGAIIDTLGTIYLNLKQYDKAEFALLQAAGSARKSDLPAVFLHLGRLRVAQGKPKDAQRYLRLVEDAASLDPRVKQDLGKDLEELRRQVETM